MKKKIRKNFPRRKIQADPSLTLRYWLYPALANYNHRFIVIMLTLLLQSYNNMYMTLTLKICIEYCDQYHLS